MDYGQKELLSYSLLTENDLIMSHI